MSGLTPDFRVLFEESPDQLANFLLIPHADSSGRYQHAAKLDAGGMTERTKVTVLKTVRGASPSWVRIPLPPR